MTTDEKYMQRCLQLAAAGAGNVAPNPMVGCVIVRDSKIIGEGFHQQFGGPHAEVMAVRSVEERALISGATVYVSLEPCSHYGKTPPCADLLVSLNLARVVVATTDPNPAVAGRGIARLREAGIEVTVGVLEAEAQEQNRRFFTFQIKKRPYIILKWAQTADGFMDVVREPGQTGIRWITAPAAQKLVHQWRSEEPAILVGSGTVLNDNPALTVRKVSGRNPLKVILDPSGRTLSRVDKMPGEKLVFINHPEMAGSDYIKIEDETQLLNQVMAELYHRNISSVLVEGGAYTLQKFLDEGLWDEARVLTGRAFFGAGLEAPRISKPPISEYMYGADRIHIFRNT